MNVERYFGLGLRPFGRNSKPVRLANKKHLDWIRDQPCIITERVGVGTDAHHVQRKSQGLNDYLTVPLSRELHMQLHSLGLGQFQDNNQFDITDALIAKLVERIIYLETELGDVGDARRK